MICERCGKRPATGRRRICAVCHVRHWREKYPERFAAGRRRYREQNRDKIREWSKAGRDRAKREAMDAYGGRCLCCGEEQIAFLTIDHIGGGGNAHRRNLPHSKAGPGFYYRLRREGYPPGYQVLCFNCNHAIGAYGACPHAGPPSSL